MQYTQRHLELKTITILNNKIQDNTLNRSNFQMQQTDSLNNNTRLAQG